MKTKKINIFFVYVILIVFVLFTIWPIVNTFFVSFKGKDEIYANPNLLPNKFKLSNYKIVLTKTPFPTFLKNSFINTIIVTLASTFIAAMAGYPIARFKARKFFKVYSRSLITLQMFPIVLLLIPLFLVFKSIGALNTRLPVIIIYITVTLPFSIWMMSGFYESIPREMEEAGMIDGCNPFQSFFLLVLPVSSPGLAAIAIFIFLFSWNEYLLASIFLKQERLRTLPVGLQTFMQQIGGDWGSLMAASILTVIPTIFFLVFMQKYIIRGLTAGAVKG